MKTPNPGSDEAIAQGCTCPVMDNGHGKGYMGGVKDEDGNVVFVMNCDCPLHGAKEGERKNNEPIPVAAADRMLLPD